MFASSIVMRSAIDALSGDGSLDLIRAEASIVSRHLSVSALITVRNLGCRCIETFNLENRLLRAIPTRQLRDGLSETESRPQRG